MAIYSFLVVVFYIFLGLFLGNRSAEITVTTLFSVVVKLSRNIELNLASRPLCLFIYLFIEL